MHHHPSSPPLSARLTAMLRRALRPRGRFAPFALVCGVIAVLAIAVPLLVPVATAGSDDEVSLDSSATGSSGGEGSSVVELGVDGAAGTPGSTAAGSPAPGSTPAADSPAADSPAADSPAADSPAADSPAADNSAAGSAAAEDPAASQQAPGSAAETGGATTSSSPSSSSAPRSAAAPASTPASSSAPRSAAAPVAAAAPAAPSAEGQVLALVNQQRATAGCGALVADSGLASLARAHSADMRDRDYFSHDTPEGLSPFARAHAAGIAMYAENIAYGQRDADSVMDDWMNSPGHRANILDCDLEKLGVGVAYGPGGPWWTQDFA